MGERRRVVVGHNPEDAPVLAVLGWDTYRPWHAVVARPTPGATDQATLVHDVMAALGKNPFTTEAPTSVADRWVLCHAWMAGAATRDLVIDRAERLPDRHLSRLAQLAHTTGVSLWLIWSGPAPERAARRLDAALGKVDAPAQVIDRFQMNDDLTARQRRYREENPPGPFTWGRGPRPWPSLPRVDFPRFLAVCRRTLTDKRFARVLAEYRTAHAATRTRWQDAVDPGIEPRVQRAQVAAWLRDDLLLDIDDAEQALIRLRAAQAALLPLGLLLNQHVDTAAVDPVPHLPGVLTEPLCGAMERAHQTGPPALLVLALHLNHDPGHLGVMRCRDVAADGSTIQLTPWFHDTYRKPPFAVEVRPSDTALTELAYAPVRLPAFARPLLAAHRAYRIATGGRSTALLFPSPADAKKPAAASALRNAARQQAEHLKVHAPWVKPVGALPGPDATWLNRRALTVDQLTDPPHPKGRRGWGW